MSQSIFHVRPLDAGNGWAIDEYDGRGAWQATYYSHRGKTPITKIEAQRRVFQLRRETLHSAPKAEPVNGAEPDQHKALVEATTDGCHSQFVVTLATP